MLALCGVIPVVAMLPGHRVYGDANNCFGYALASLGDTEHHVEHCTPSYTKLERTEPAGGWPAIGLAIAIAIGVGVLYRRPRRSTAVLCWLWCMLAAAGTLVLTINFDLFDRVVVLWPEQALAFVFGTIGVLVTVAPIVAFVTREKPSDSLPVATGSTGSR